MMNKEDNNLNRGISRAALLSFLFFLFTGTSFHPTVAGAESAAGNSPSVTVNLSDFGAVGDGVTDDGPALQSALDSLAESAAGGDATLVVPEGRYALITPVLKDFGNAINSLTIVGPTPYHVPESGGLGRGLGLSAEFVIKVGEGADAITLLNLPNFLIQDMVFIGDPSVGTDALLVLALHEIGNATIRHCEFYGLASLSGPGAMLAAHHSYLNLEDSAFLGCTTNSGTNTASVVRNTLWRGIKVSGTRFVDYGNRPYFYSKTPLSATMSWISAGNAAPPDEQSAWREVIIRDVFLDEGGYIGFMSSPEFYAPYYGGGGPIDLIHIQGLRMNVSNLEASGIYLKYTERVLIEDSYFGWSHRANAAIHLADVDEAILARVECVKDANRIHADWLTGRLTVLNSIYTTLDSQAQTTEVVNTTDEDDPVKYVRAQFLSELGREADSAGLFYWSDQILRCGSDSSCKAERQAALSAYLASAPPARHTISGTVTNSEGGAPMQSVAMALSGSQEVSFPTDAAGNYSFANLPTSGVYTVTPSKTHYTFNPPSRTLTTPNGDRDADFAATINRHMISGRAVNAKMQPLAGVTLTLSGSLSATTTTDANGDFSFAALTAGGTYTVTPFKTNYSFRLLSPPTVVNLSSDQSLPTFIADLNLYTLSGRVTTSGGMGIDGARVNLSGSLSTVTLTDSDGYYSFRLQPGDYTVTLTHGLYNFTPASRTFNNLSQNEQGLFTAEPKTFSVGGRVVQQNAQPLGGVTVTLSGAQSATTTTASDGTYWFAVKAGGTYTLTPSLPGYLFGAYPSGQPSHTFSAIDGNRAVDFTGRYTQTVRGRITTPDGAGLGGVAINLSGAQTRATTTDAGGNYSFILPVSQNYTLTPSLTHHDFTPQSLAFNNLSADRTANFSAVKNRSMLSGRVLNASGAPLSGVAVNLSGTRNASVLTGADGRYSFSELPNGGSYTVTPSKRHYTFAAPSLTFSNLSNDQTTDFTATLNRHTVGGRITKADGTPIAGVSVALSGSQIATATTDSGGNYSFSNLPAGGTYTLAPSKTHYTFTQPSRTLEDLSANQIADFTGAPVSYTVGGRVTKADGSGLAGVTVTLGGSQAGTTTTDGSGNFSFSLQAEGNYTLTPSKSLYNFAPPSRTLNNLSGNQTINFAATLQMFSINGRVVNAGGNAISGVTLQLSGSQSGTATTDANGNYSFANLPATGSYAVTPSKANHSFTPPSQTFNNLADNKTANFTGTLVNYQIGGRVTAADGTGLGGVNVSLSGSQTGSATTDSGGNYSFTVLAEGNYTVTPSKADYSFSPASHSFTLLGSNQVANFTGSLFDSLQFGAASYNVAENAGSLQITVTRRGGASAPAQVNYAITGGTARPGSDLNTVVGTLHFTATETSRNITVFITDDAHVEGEETVTITLSGPTGGAVLRSPETTTITIADNDTVPSSSNPIDAVQFFVRQHYIDFFNREPDAAGLDFWMREITNCGSDAACIEHQRTNVSAAFFLSPEFQTTGYFVYRLYKASYARVPRRVEEFLPGIQFVGQNVVGAAPGWEQQLEQNKTAFAAEFVQREQFRAAYPAAMTPEQFVAALNTNTGNALTSAELVAATGEFGGAATSADLQARARALRRVAESREFNQRELNPAFVLMQYFAYLQRNPNEAPDADLTGYNFWLKKLNEHGGDFRAADMVRSFLISTEYRQRFGR